MRVAVSLIRFPALRIFSLLLSYLVQFVKSFFFFVLLYFLVMFGCYFLYVSYCFLMEQKGRVHPKERGGGGMLGGVKGDKTVVGMCCMEQTNKQNDR